MQEFTTPMMKQYMEIKRQYADCLLFFRMGDFYELFLDDALVGAQVLDITLTGRPKGKDGRIPMAGVPYHAVDSYLSKLVKAGYKVAICEQVSLPNKYGIVDREVIRVVTPGTVLDEKALDKKENNYIVSLLYKGQEIGITFADISTGEFQTMQIKFEDLETVIKDELFKLSPTECILPEEIYNDPQVLKILKTEKNLNIYPFFEWQKYAGNAKSFLKKHFGVSSLSGFGIDDLPLSLQTAASLLGYLQETQKDKVSHIKKITTISPSDFTVMDRSTMLNLELFSTIREHDTRGTLLSVLDQTYTAMGGRMVRLWIKKPLCDKKKIEERYDAVEELLKDYTLKTNAQEALKTITDIERVLSRLSVGVGNARDFVSLKYSLKSVLELKACFKKSKNKLLQKLTKQITKEVDEVVSLIETHILEEPAFDLKGGGLIRDGVSLELDTLRARLLNSRDWIANLEAKERERTGISSLKVKFNKVFGFYIEISNANLHLVPQDFIRKQTLVNGERFITPDLKVQEELILTAEEKMFDLEYKIFKKVREKLLDYITPLQNAAESVGALDCLISFANIAQENSYTRPQLIYSGEIKIIEGRHPVVEKLLEEQRFVPNNLELNNIKQQLVLITGPNMAGKSVYIRQVALIVLMAQIGCFVPAKKAYISLTDRIFVRSGASDVITSGLSTFMVEMVETANILNHATKKSLIVMDEIGRGTSTYDGISIAWAVAEYLVSKGKNSPKTLFATHYHELQALEEKYPTRISNYHLSVSQTPQGPIFLHTVLPGGASHSFGVAVAKLAGVPKEVIDRAQEILQELEDDRQRENSFNLSNNQDRRTNHVLEKELAKIDILKLTPLDALNTLARLKELSNGAN